MSKSVRSSSRSRRAAPGLTGAVVGTLVACDSHGHWRVDFPGNPDAVAKPARSTVGLTRQQVGASVVLVFDGGHADRPIITGVLEPPRSDEPSEPTEVRVDGCTVTVSAHRELVLRCGRSSITLTRAGKIILRGAYILSRSTGVNSIKGGSVQIN